MWTKIGTFCVILLLYGGSVRCMEGNDTPDSSGVLQFLRNILSQDYQQSQIFQELAPGRSRRDAEKECGGTVHGGMGSLKSPGFPEGYAQDLLCAWKIEAPISKQLLLRFMFFDVKGGTRGICSPGEDYVLMRDGSRTGQRLGIFCNALLTKSSLPSAILSVTNEVWIIFHTNSKDEGKGFLISFQSVNSVKFSKYIADQITFEPSTEVGSSSAGRSSTEVKTTEAPTTLLLQSAVNPATTFLFTHEGNQLTPTAGDTFSFESVAFGNPYLGPVHFGDGKGSHVDYTIPPVLDTPLSVTDLSTQPNHRILPKDTTATRAQSQSTSQLQTMSSTDRATSHRALETEQPVTQSTKQFVISAKSFVVTSKQQEATETELLPITQTELKTHTQTKQESLLQFKREFVSPPDWQPATGGGLQMRTKRQTETQAVDDTQVKQKITAQAERQLSTKAMQLHISEPQLTITNPKSDEPGHVATSPGQFVSSTEEVHASEAYYQPTTKSQKQFFIQTEQPSLPEFDFLKPVTETKLLPTSELLSLTVRGQYTVTQIRDIPEAKQQPDSQPDLGTKSWQQFVTQIQEIPVTAVKQEPLTKPDELQPTTKSLAIEQETIAQTKQLLTTSNLTPTTKPGSHFVTQTEELTNLSGLQQLTSSRQQEISQTGRLQTDAKQQPVTKPDGQQLLTRPWKRFNFITIQPSVTEIDNQELVIQTEKQVGTQFQKAQTLPKYRQHFVIPTIVPSVAMAKTDLQQPEQVLTELYELKPVSRRRQQSDSPTGPPDRQTGKHQYITELKETGIRTEQYIGTQTDTADIGTKQPTQMFTHLEQVSTAEYQPKSTTEISVKIFSDEPKETISQQHLPTPTKSTTTTEQHPDVKTQWQTLTKEQRKPLTDAPEADIKLLTVPPSAEYQPKSTSEIAVKQVSDEPKETISQQHLPTPTKSTTTTEQHPDVKTQWQTLTKEQRKPLTDAPEADIKLLTAPPSQPQTPPPPPPPTPPPSYPDYTPEPKLPLEDFEDPPTQSLSEVVNILVNVNLHDERSILQACDYLNVTMNETLEAFKSLSQLAQGLEYTKSLLTARYPMEMLNVNLSGDAALDDVHLYPFLLIQTLEVSVAEMISKASDFLTHTIQNASHIQSDIPEASCIQGYSQQLLNALQRDTSINGSLDLVEDVLRDLFGFDLTERLKSGLGIDEDKPTLATDGELWDFNQVISNPSGELQSPNYPDAYPMGVRYRWNITVRPQGRISLNFTHFDLDSALIDNQCDSRYAHVTVDDGSGPEADRKRVFCDQEVPNTIVSSSNMLIVTFVSSYGYGTGFHADFALHNLGEDRDIYQYLTTVVPDQVCGGVLTKRTGSIKSPNYPGDFETSVDCQWIITVESGLTIFLNFTDLNLDSFPIDNWCSESYAHVKVIDGNHGSSHVYCGKEVPPLFISSTNAITVSFVSMFGYGGRFYAVYKALQQDSKSLLTTSPDIPSTEQLHPCGGNLEGPTGVIQSPNYPGDFEVSVDCQWIVTVHYGLIIALNFTDFNLDSYPVDNWCSESYAHVQVIDGIHGSSLVYCGQEVPPLFISSTNAITVSFVSMFGYGGRFYAVYKALQQDSKSLLTKSSDVPSTEQPHPCGGNLEGLTGVIQSPNYPGDFAASVDCQWIVTVESGLIIALNFTDFNLDSYPVDNWCSEVYAHVEVIDGIHGKSHVYCGQEVPPLFISSTNTLTVSFISMFGYGGRFYAFYKALQQDSKSLLTTSPDVPSKEQPHPCGGNMEGPTGVIQSPNYPGDFTASVDCQWIVTVEYGLIIALNFTDFSLDSFPVDDWCSQGYAHVEIIDGIQGSSHVYCGQEVPPLFVSSTNTITVSFVSMFGYGGRFFAFFKVLKQHSKSLFTTSPDVPSTEQPHPCGGNLEGQTGVVQSPNYPGDFEAGVDCQWIIIVEHGHIIALNFTDFNLDSYPVDNWCSESYAHLKITDGIHGRSHVYCGQEVPPVFISSTNAITVSFVSMFGYGGRFFAFYKAFQQDSKSHLTLSPDVPSKEEPHPCGGNLEGPTGFIQSPNYPGDFEAGVDCKWIITVDSGLTISLNFTDFILDSFPIDNWCSEGYAHVKVIDGNQGNSYVYCGQEVPPPYISSTNTLTVTFISMFGYGGGFHAVYTAHQQHSKVLFTSPPGVKPTESECGGTFNSPGGVIQMPDHSGDFDMGLSCQWNITVDIKAVISLTFTEFNLDSLPIDNKCNEGYAHVKVVDGNFGKNNIYCGQELPAPFISTTNTLLLVFDSLYGYGGRFQAVYLAVQTDGSGSGDLKLGMTPVQPSSMPVTEPLCGGSFNQPSGIIQLPEQTGDNCRWNITVEYGWIMLLTFTAFDIDSYMVDGQCDEKYAHVKVMDLEATYIFCGQNIPPKVTSRSRTLIVDYVGVYGYGEGFQAFYVVRDADFGWLDARQVTAALSSPSHILTDKSVYQCGGNLNLPYGTIQSPSYSGEQATDMTCRWTITVGDKWLIQLAFTEFNLDSASINGQCDQRYEYLKIVDGSSEFVYCGQDSPNIYVSSTDYLIVIFYTNYGYGDGFTAEYTVKEPDRILSNTLSPSTSKLPSAVLPYKCGGDISTPTGEIKSPNFPSDYTSAVNCIWKITLEASSKVALSFTVFNVDSMPFENDCDARYAHLLVIDGNSEDTSPQRVYCGQDLPGDFVSTSNSLIISFISQYGYGGRFRARYSSLKLDDDYFKLFPSTSNPSEKTVSQSEPTSKTHEQILDCGGILDSPDGVIQSPYLSTMERAQSVNCQWYIELQEAGTITIVFKYFDLDSVVFESGCEEMYANLKITNTRTGASQVYCGQDVPPSFIASTNELLIIFSGLLGFSRGFRAEYHYTKPLPSVDPTAVLPTSSSAVARQLPSCGSMLRGDYADFSSPGYPNAYPVNTKCSWNIFVDSTHFIALKFLDFDVDNPMEQPDCSIHYSYVKVSYPGEGGIEETHLLCGSEQPEILNMRTHSAVVYFESNLGMGRGFKASYQAYSSSSSDLRTTAKPAATESVISPMVLTTQSGQILSLNYPMQFPHNLDKLWIIRPARQTFITLIFEDIDFDAITGENGQCNTLYTHVALTTYNIDIGNSEVLFCSNEMKTTVYSYGELKLAFHSRYGVGRGFKATYSSDIPTEDIGFVTKESVTSTPKHSQFISKESVMNTRDPREEFTEGCLYTLTQGRGHFSSPNYPGMYPPEIVCQWIMLAPTGWLVRLDFSQFLLDSDDFPPCDTKYSHVVITTTNSYNERDYTYCGQQLPPRIISPANKLVVTFRSMFGIDFGFFATYQFISAETYQGSFGPAFTDGDKDQGSDAGKTTSSMSSQEVDNATQVTEGSLISDTPCERVFSNPEGVIRSPFFPQGMPQGEECTWIVTVPGEQGIHLTFLDFYLDDHEVDTSTCTEDSASVSVLMDGSQYEFCGNVPPSPLISTGNSVIIELKTMSGNGPGFRMHFIDASLVSADSVTSHIRGDITESGTSVADSRFLGEGGMTVSPNGDKRDITRPGKDRVNVPVLQPDDPSSITASTSVSNVETEVGMTATGDTMTTVNMDYISTLSGYTSPPKMTGIGSTSDSGDVLTSQQLRITAYVCGSVSFILFIILVLLTSICIYKRRRRHSSKSVKMGQSEKSYWQNYKSWAREYTGGPNKPQVADEEGEEAVPIPEQERLV